jgi:hypothetical protein
MNDAKNKDRYEDTIVVLELLIRDIFALSKGTGRDSIANSDISDKLMELSSNTDARRLEFWITDLEELQFNYLVNINRKVATDGVFVKMAGA